MIAHSTFLNRSRSSGSFLKNSLKIIITLPLVIIIVGALAIALEASLENLRFTQATNQIVTIVLAAHNFAVNQSTFAQEPGEDLLATLIRHGQIVPNNGAEKNLVNPWLGEIHGVVASPSVLRIESIVPTRDCRRMAAYFIKSAYNFSILAVAARSDDKEWHELYRETDLSTPSAELLEHACGRAQNAELATEFRLR